MPLVPLYMAFGLIWGKRPKEFPAPGLGRRHQKAAKAPMVQSTNAKAIRLDERREKGYNSQGVFPACVAQLAEQFTRNEQAAGSNPAASSMACRQGHALQGPPQRGGLSLCTKLTLTHKQPQAKAGGCFFGAPIAAILSTVASSPTCNGFPAIWRRSRPGRRPPGESLPR